MKIITAQSNKNLKSKLEHGTGKFKDSQKITPFLFFEHIWCLHLECSIQYVAYMKGNLVVLSYLNDIFVQSGMF